MPTFENRYLYDMIFMIYMPIYSQVIIIKKLQHLYHFFIKNFLNILIDVVNNYI